MYTDESLGVSEARLIPSRAPGSPGSGDGQEAPWESQQGVTGTPAPHHGGRRKEGILGLAPQGRSGRGFTET